MAKFLHASTFDKFAAKKVSADSSNTTYVTYTYENGVITASEEATGTPDILWTDIVFISDPTMYWTHGNINRSYEVDSSSATVTIKQSPIIVDTIDTYSSIDDYPTDDLETGTQAYWVNNNHNMPIWWDATTQQWVDYAGHDVTDSYFDFITWEEYSTT